MITEIKEGDRVRMDPEYTYLGVPAPDLGEGTVVATEGEHLMAGWYVEVNWDENHGSQARYPAIQALIKIEKGPDMQTKSLNNGMKVAYKRWSNLREAEEATVIETGVRTDRGYANGVRIKVKGEQDSKVVEPKTLVSTWEAWAEETDRAAQARQESIERMQAAAKAIKDRLPKKAYRDIIGRTYGFEGKVHADGSFSTEGRISVYALADLVEAAYNAGKESAR